MRCLPCFQAQKSITDYPKPDHGPSRQEFTDPETKNQNPRDGIDQVAMDNTSATTFTFRELATATRNFRHEFLLSEGGFGRVFKGTLASNGQVVAVKKLDRSGMNGNQEFLREISKLSLLHHPNLVNLIGYCADGDQRLLVYEYMPAGSLENHLRCTLPDQKPLVWFTRMRVALGTAKGLEYLHNQASPPIIYRDLKPSNILLDEHCNPKLCDYGLAKLPRGDSMFVPSRVVGTYGYCAPEYARSGQLTLKSDVYCFGVILLELITGRRALDTTRPMNEQNLVAWAQPIFKDPKRFPDMADPLLKRRFPEKDLNQAVAIAAMCLQEEPAARPLMSDVVTTLIFLSVATEESLPLSTPPLEDDAIKDDDDQCETEAGDSSGDEDNSSESNDDEDSSSDEDSEQEHDFYASDSQDEDGVCEHQQTDSESKRRRKSSMKSINESVSASQKSSKKSRSRRVSLGQKSSSVTDNGSVSSGDDSSRGSIKENALLNKESSKNSQRNQKGSLRLKSRKNSTKAFLSHKSSIHSLFSLKHGSSKGSTEGSVSPSHLGSGRSQNYEGSFSSSSSGELAMESDISSLTSESKS